MGSHAEGVPDPAQGKTKRKGKDSHMQGGNGGQKGYYGYNKGSQKGSTCDSKGGKRNER